MLKSVFEMPYQTEFKFIDFRNYFKSKHFKDLKFLVNFSNLNPWYFLNIPNKIFFNHPNKFKCPNHVIKSCYPNRPKIMGSDLGKDLNFSGSVRILPTSDPH